MIHVFDLDIEVAPAQELGEVGPGPHGWLTESVFLSLGERLPDRVRLKVFRVD